MTVALVLQDPESERRIHESFVRQKVMGLIGADLTRLEPGRIEIELLTALTASLVCGAV